jgi:rhodanese-related sulfurtransferase
MSSHEMIESIERRARHEEPWAMRLLVAAAAIFGAMTILVAARAGESLEDPAWKRHVSSDCQSPECLAPRQFVTLPQARSLKRDGGAIVLDIRMASEPGDPLPHLAADARVPFTQSGTYSHANPIAQSPALEIRPTFATDADDAMRAFGLRGNQPVIVVSPSLERSMLAALLLQERGYPRVLVLYA